MKDEHGQELEQQTDDAELVPEDDAIIGRVFRISVVVLVVVGALVAGGVWLAGRGETGPPPQVVERAAPQAVEREMSVPVAVFRDVTREAGIDFVHVNGAEGEKLLPETMGGGSAFFDLGDDGDPDLLLVNSTAWSSETPGAESPTMALYENDGRGVFVDVTAERGLDVTFYGMGISVGDLDCDGDRDLFFTAVGSNHSLLADGDGRFAAARLGLQGAADAWSTCSALFDADRDGDLDLYVGNYVHWSREIDFQVDYRLTGIGRAYGPPTNFGGSHAQFLRNEGEGRFVDASAEAGFQIDNPATRQPMGKALGVRPYDVDDDGWIDLMVANDTVQNFFFHNRGDGTFAERGAEFGLAFDRNGNATGAMGIDGAHYRDDADLGFVIGNFANEMSSLYVTQGRPSLFADEAIGEGVGAPSRKRLSFGVCFIDYDLDGRLDLLQANGHLEDEISQVQASQTYQQPAQLFWNAGPERRRCFEEVSAVGDLSRPIVGRGASYADVDGDGDQDVLLTQTGGRPLLLRNDQAGGHHWLRLRLEDAGCNRDALGAKVELHAGGRVQRRDVMPTRSYLSQVELSLTFGLGTVDVIDRVEVLWPDGERTSHEGLAVDRVHVLRREG